MGDASQGCPQDLGGGGPRIFFFEIWKFACREATCCARQAARHAAHGEAMRFGRGVRGHAPPRKFLKMVQFGAFWCTFGSDFLL